MTSQPRKRQPRYALYSCKPVPGSREDELWHHNQETSPFLRLPPELRNRIYALVLTVGQIKVNYKPWQHKRRIKHGEPYTETIPGGFWTQVLEPEQIPWRNHASNPRPLEITLLSPVCRQLYKEAAVLPFRLNTWSFEDQYVMNRYLLKEKRLSLPQRRAIQTVFAQEHLPEVMLKFLGGLRTVFLWEQGLKRRQARTQQLPDLRSKHHTARERDREFDIWCD